MRRLHFRSPMLLEGPLGAALLTGSVTDCRQAAPAWFGDIHRSLISDYFALQGLSSGKCDLENIFFREAAGGPALLLA